MTLTRLSSTFDAKRDKEALERLIVARIRMLIKNPFFGNIATRLVLENADSWCETMATNGRKLWYNSKFTMELQEDEVDFLVGHELLHVIYDHIARTGDRNVKLANIAQDYVVNDGCVEYKFGVMPRKIPGLFDMKYHGWNFEQVYEDLLNNMPKLNIDNLIDKMLDDHSAGDPGAGDPGAGGDEDGEGEGKTRGSGRPVPLTAEERQQVKDEIKEAMLSAAAAVGVGNVPGNMKRLLDSLTESKMNWREVLNQQIESQVKNDFTYMKPSRRGWGCDAILPSMTKQPTVEVTIFIDLSGSIGQKEMVAFMSEMIGITQQFSSVSINVACFDTQVYNYQSFTEDNLDDLTSYEIVGGGGTNFDCIWKYMKDNELQPKQVLVFTDLECNVFGDPDYCETIWLVKNEHRKDLEAPHGITLVYGD